MTACIFEPFNEAEQEIPSWENHFPSYLWRGYVSSLRVEFHQNQEGCSLFESMSEYDSKKECSAKGPVRARFAGSERESLQIFPSDCLFGRALRALVQCCELPLRSAAGPNDARSVGAREKRLAHSRMVPRHDNLGQVTQELNPLPGSPEDPAIIATNGKGIPYLRGSWCYRLDWNPPASGAYCCFVAMTEPRTC